MVSRSSVEGSWTVVVPVDTSFPPGYPALLAAPHATNCRWWIRVPQNQTIEIEFLDFDVKYLAEDDSRWAADPRCLQASLSLFTVGDGNEFFFTRHPIGRFCNDNKPPDDGIVAKSPVLELQYSRKGGIRWKPNQRISS